MTAVPEASSPPVWLQAVLQRLNDFVYLGPDWDSYGARPIENSACIAVLDLLLQNQWDGPEPTVTPTPSGGVMLGWEADDKGVELWLDPTGSVTAVVDDEQEGIREITGLASTGDAVHSILNQVRRW
ncbi:MAG: hypothetical protein M3256_21865 [Actinomycetota bacterium]|nr:hypothetical protein [Actinomycetota bacterium]